MKTILIFSVITLFISATNISREYYPGPECAKISTKDRRRILTTGKGIKLGDAPEDVIKIYGEPENKKTKDEILIFEYHTDPMQARQVSLYYDAYLYFKENKPVKLYIHDGE